MIVEDVKNPIYANAQNTEINCSVKFDTIPEYLPFTASPSDPMDYGRQLYDDLIAGKWGNIAPFPMPPIVEQVGPNVIT